MNTKETTDIFKVNRACPSLEKGSHKNTAAVPFIFATHAVQHHTPPIFFSRSLYLIMVHPAPLYFC